MLSDIPGQGSRVQSTTPDSEKFAKNREKEGTNQIKSGKKRKNREVFFFTLPLLTDRAGYATAGGGGTSGKKKKKKKKTLHVIRVVLQDQAMYARTSFRGAKSCKIEEKKKKKERKKRKRKKKVRKGVFGHIDKFLERT